MKGDYHEIAEESEIPSGRCDAVFVTPVDPVVNISLQAPAFTQRDPKCRRKFPGEENSTHVCNAVG